MSKRLARVSSRFMDHNHVAYRVSAAGVRSAIYVPFKLRVFSADVKRKTAAYDRIGVTCSDDHLKPGEVSLVQGDYILSGGDRFLVSKLIQNVAVLPGRVNTTQWQVEAYYCNAVINLTRTTVSRDPDTGIPLTPVTVVVYSDVWCSISTAEMFVSEPNKEPKDEFFLRTPGPLSIEKGDDITITSWQDTDGKFQHDTYIVKYLEPDTIGVTTSRLGASPNAAT